MNDLNDMDNIPKKDRSSELKGIQALRIELKNKPKNETSELNDIHELRVQSQKKSKSPNYAIAIGAVVSIGAIGAALICESDIVGWIFKSIQEKASGGIINPYVVQEEMKTDSESHTLGNISYESNITSD